MTDKKTRGMISGIFFALTLIIDTVMIFGSTSSSNDNVWETAELWTEGSFIPVACVLFIAVYIFNIAISVVGTVISFAKDKVYAWPVASVLLSHMLLLAVNFAFEVLDDGIWIILATVVIAFGTVLNVVSGIKASKSVDLAERQSKLKKPLTLIGCISAFLSLSLFCIPLCSYTVDRVDYAVVPMGVFAPDEDSVINLVLFVVMVIVAAVNAVLLLGSFKNTSDETTFQLKIRNLVNVNTVITGIYFIAGVALCSIKNSDGAEASTVSYLPFIATAAVAIVSAVYTRNAVSNRNTTLDKTSKAARLEFFGLGAAVSLLTAVAALGNILTITFREPVDIEDIVLDGYDILMTYNSLEAGLQVVAFLIIAVLTVVIALFGASLIALISKSKLFFKITLAEVLGGAVCSLLIGLFGKYYEVVQHLNEEVMRSLIESSGSPAYVEFDYTVSSQSFIWFIVVMLVVAVILFRKPYSRGTVGETPVMVGGTAGTVPATEPMVYSPDTDEALIGGDNSQSEFDPCPAFTQLDRKISYFISEGEARKTYSFKEPTLPELVQFVVSYARDCRLHLSYTQEDIAAFVAGLGATRLTILQGMSGTGKTSLPKIFAEAILGNCEIVEVESSWRDKNELLGYYNEFSKTYTPKKFTQALYKAKLNPETVTFIVLDEMNLSRIEYYFSDFLSLMENEEDKREIKLLNVVLRRNENGKNQVYYGLADGHTIKIPNNVWFVGTANRDESTFEISDKVYDRAHTMNFNKRAQKPLTYGQPIAQRYITVETFVQLLENAKTAVRFDIDNYPLIKDVEMLLEPYNISFGNRIARQIEDFVSIYCSCFMNPDIVLHDAVERILLSKVVSKLEFKSVENKVQLAAEFEKRNLHRCSEFILKLNED